MNFLKKHRVLLFFAFSVLILILLRIPSLFEPHWYDDEGIYSGVANQMSYGAELYSGAWDNKPPFMYLLFLSLLNLGNTLFLTRLLSLLFAVGTLVIVHKILQKVAVGRIKYFALIGCAIFFGIPQMENNLANAENFFILFTTLGIYFALNKKFWLTAIFYGLAVTIKAQPYFEFISLLPIILIFFYHAKEQSLSILRRLAKLVTLFVFPTVIITLIFLLFGNFTEYLDSSLLSNFKYVEEGGEKAMFLIFENSIFLRSGIFLIILSILSLLYWKKKISFTSAIIFVWVASSVFGAALSSRGYPHYLLQAVPSFVVLIGYALSEKVFSFKFLRNVLIISVSTLLFVFYFFQGKNFEEHLQYSNYYQLGYGYLLGNVNRTEWSDFFNPKLKYMYETAQYIDNVTEDGTTIYSVDHTGWFYELSSTKSASRYVAYYHIWHTENRTEKAFKDIEDSKPEYLVFNRKEAWIFPDLWKYIENNFVKDGFENEWYEVYVRKELLRVD